MEERKEVTMWFNATRLSGHIFLTLLLALTIVLTGCEGMYSERASKEQDELAKRFKPQSTSAVIYIYRPKSLEIPRAIFVYNDGGFVASLKGGAFVRLVLTPGRHVIGTKSPSARFLQDTLAIVADAGKLYYIMVRYQLGGVTGDSPKLRQVDERTAQRKIRGYELLQVGPLR